MSSSRVPPFRERVYEGCRLFRVPLAAVDMVSLRAAFVPLFDEALITVYEHGGDADDSILERFVVCRIGDQPPHTVAVDRFASAEVFRTQVQSALWEHGVPFLDGDVMLESVAVQAFIERW